MGCRAGANAVILLENSLLLGDDPAGRHDGVDGWWMGWDVVGEVRLGIGTVNRP